jgi:peptide/nickel transport system permease protein
LLHIVVAFAGFFAPYDFSTQYRSLPYCPPTRLHLVRGGRYGSWHPIVYPVAQDPAGSQQYHEEVRKPYPIHLLFYGTKYLLFDRIECHRHLFGVDLHAKLFILGTDAYGRDQLSRLLYGGQITIATGIIATAVSLGTGTILGVLAGMCAGWADVIIMRCIDLFTALPFFYLLLVLRGWFPLNLGTVHMSVAFALIMGLLGWARPAHIVRDVVISMKEAPHILAARSFGASEIYLLRRHIVPELRLLMSLQVAILIPGFVITELSLSFFGLGAQEPFPSWGGMLANLQHYHVLLSKWWMLLPGLTIVAFTICYGVLSHSLRASGATFLK